MTRTTPPGTIPSRPYSKLGWRTRYRRVVGHVVVIRRTAFQWNPVGGVSGGMDLDHDDDDDYPHSLDHRRGHHYYCYYLLLLMISFDSISDVSHPWWWWRFVTSDSRIAVGYRSFGRGVRTHLYPVVVVHDTTCPVCVVDSMVGSRCVYSSGDRYSDSIVPDRFGRLGVQW